MLVLIILFIEKHSTGKIHLGPCVLCNSHSIGIFGHRHRTLQPPTAGGGSLTREIALRLKAHILALIDLVDNVLPPIWSICRCVILSTLDNFSVSTPSFPRAKIQTHRHDFTRIAKPLIKARSKPELLDSSIRRVGPIPEALLEQLLPPHRVSIHRDPPGGN